MNAPLRHRPGQHHTFFGAGLRTAIRALRGIDSVILGNLTNQTRDDDSFVEIVVEITNNSFNYKKFVKSIGEYSLLFLLEV